MKRRLPAAVGGGVTTAAVCQAPEPLSGAATILTGALPIGNPSEPPGSRSCDQRSLETSIALAGADSETGWL